MRITNLEAPLCAILSSLLFLLPSSVSFSAPNYLDFALRVLFPWYEGPSFTPILNYKLRVLYSLTFTFLCI